MPYAFGQIIGVQLCYCGKSHIINAAQEYTEIILGIPEDPTYNPLFLIMLRLKLDNGESERVNIVTNGDDFWEFASVCDVELVGDSCFYIINGSKCDLDDANYNRFKKVLTYFVVADFY